MRPSESPIVDRYLSFTPLDWPPNVSCPQNIYHPFRLHRSYTVSPPHTVSPSHTVSLRYVPSWPVSSSRPRRIITSDGRLSTVVRLTDHQVRRFGPSPPWSRRYLRESVDYLSGTDRNI